MKYAFVQSFVFIAIGFQQFIELVNLCDLFSSSPLCRHNIACVCSQLHVIAIPITLANTSSRAVAAKYTQRCGFVPYFRMENGRWFVGISWMPSSSLSRRPLSRVCLCSDVIMAIYLVTFQCAGGPVTLACTVDKGKRFNVALWRHNITVTLHTRRAALIDDER